MDLEKIARLVREGEAIARKREIRHVTGLFAERGTDRELKDDAALLDLGGKKILIATDSIATSLCEAAPRFAGWCAIAVTANDIWATGGRPKAATTVLGAGTPAKLRAMALGAAEAAEALGIEIVGGHVNSLGSSPAAAATVFGEVQAELPAGGARPGDLLLAAVDLRGRWMRGWSGAWNSHRGKKPGKLRGDLALLPQIAEEGLARACKDVSNAGVLGTLAILLETSRVGGRIRLDKLPMPKGVSWKRWIGAFPSYGFLLATHSSKAEKLRRLFNGRGIAAEVVGEATADRRVVLEEEGREALLFDFQKERIL